MIKINTELKSPQGWTTTEAVVVINSSELSIRNYFNSDLDDQTLLSIMYNIYKSELDYNEGAKPFQPNNFPYHVNFPYTEGEELNLEALEFKVKSKLIESGYDVAQPIEEGGEE